MQHHSILSVLPKQDGIRAVEIADLLRDRVVFLSGGRDRTGRTHTDPF